MGGAGLRGEGRENRFRMSGLKMKLWGLGWASVFDRFLMRMHDVT